MAQHPGSWGDRHPLNPDVTFESDRFKDERDEYEFNLIRAEYHLHRAMELANKMDAPKRSLVYKTLLSRAYGIVAGLYRQESQARRSK